MRVWSPKVRPYIEDQKVQGTIGTKQKTIIGRADTTAVNKVAGF